MWDWVTDVASTAWDWATDNASDAVAAATNYVTSRNISANEASALQKAIGSMANVNKPNLSQYRTSSSRSNAGIPSFSDIKEESGTTYAQFLYYTRSYLQTKAKYESSVPLVSYAKTGLGSKS